MSEAIGSDASKLDGLMDAMITANGLHRFCYISQPRISIAPELFLWRPASTKQEGSRVEPIRLSTELTPLTEATTNNSNVRADDPNAVVGWTKLEDSVLIALVEHYGQRKWSSLVSHLPGKSEEQAILRFGVLKPDLALPVGAWTPEEISLLFRLKHVYGLNWDSIAGQMHGRSSTQINIRYQLVMRVLLCKATASESMLIQGYNNYDLVNPKLFSVEAESPTALKITHIATGHVYERSFN